MVRLLLDYDGTLHDGRFLYTPAFQTAYQVLVDRGYRPPRTWRPEETAVWLGITPQAMWEAFAPDVPEPLRRTCSQIILEEMLRRTAAGEARLYPGVPAVLEALRGAGYSLILLSSCQRSYLEVHRQQFGLDRYLDGSFCTQAWGWAPKWAVFPAIRRAFPGEYAVVGDRASDGEAARRNGLPFVGCAYGYGTPEELAGAAARISAPEELPRALIRLGLTP